MTLIEAKGRLGNEAGRDGESRRARSQALPRMTQEARRLRLLPTLALPSSGLRVRHTLRWRSQPGCTQLPCSDIVQTSSNVDCIFLSMPSAQGL